VGHVVFNFTARSIAVDGVYEARWLSTRAHLRLGAPLPLYNGSSGTFLPVKEG